MNQRKAMCAYWMVVVLLTAVSGCTPPGLASNQQLELDPDDIRTILIDPAETETTLTVNAQSDAPIEVYVYLSDDDEEIDRAITLGKLSDLLLASELDSTAISLKAKIPAGREACVRLQTAGSEKATVELKLGN